MKTLKIYGPDDLPDDSENGITPNIELIEGVLRMHFHKGGVSFGLVEPSVPSMSRVVTYAEARAIMVSAAAHAAGCGGAGG